VFLGPDGFRLHARALHHSEELVHNYFQSLQAREHQLTVLEDRMTLLIPEQSERWLLEEYLRRKLFARSETPGAAHIPPLEELERMWNYFLEKWCLNQAVRTVKAQEYDYDELPPIGRFELDHLRTRRLSLTMLPALSPPPPPLLCNRLRGELDDRDSNEAGALKLATKLAEEAAKRAEADATHAKETTTRAEEKDSARAGLETMLTNGLLVALQVSAAELNPRYRGQRLTDPDDVSRALRHWALCYGASEAIVTPATSSTTEPDSQVVEESFPHS
jgi:hypothetical protein